MNRFVLGTIIAMLLVNGGPILAHQERQCQESATVDKEASATSKEDIEVIEHLDLLENFEMLQAMALLQDYEEVSSEGSTDEQPTQEVDRE